jgi:ABC-type Fe3+-siderophore transport system permease subunit
MALTRITLLLAEDHAYGIFYWLAGGVSHARWQEFWQLFPMVVIVTRSFCCWRINLICSTLATIPPIRWA